MIALLVASLAALSVVAMAGEYNAQAPSPHDAGRLIMPMARRAHVDKRWYDAHATFYGDLGGGETMQGACGYGDLFKQGYGLETAALSTALFNNGLTCGACFELYCDNAPYNWCKRGTIKITATNLCPPSDKPSTAGGWCNPPLRHFDLSEKMFLKIAEYKAGIVPVKYRRILCYKQGGVQFQLGGNQYWLLVLIYNVGGAGDVVDVKVKGSKTGWVQMTRNWGQNWQSLAVYGGQGLSFQVTTSDRKTLWFNDVVPWNWNIGQTFQGKYNF
ncbi:hypothetical protein ACFE04_012630 [Oxalis oulophora]